MLSNFFPLIGLILFKVTTAQAVLSASNNECECGEEGSSTFAKRIIGGIESQRLKHASAVGLLDCTTKNLFCGASIICSRYVATTAHCVDRAVDNGYDVVLAVGTHDLTDANLIEIETSIKHPLHNPATHSHNIALIKTKDVIVLSGQTIKSICLPPANYVPAPGDWAVVAGWGRTSLHYGSFSNVLREVELQFVGRDQCRVDLGYRVDETMVCFGGDGIGSSALYDGGSGLLKQCQSSKRWSHIGMTSWGASGEDALNKPSAYTNVAYFRDWIQSQVDEDCVMCEHACNDQGGLSRRVVGSKPVQMVPYQPSVEQPIHSGF